MNIQWGKISFEEADYSLNLSDNRIIELTRSDNEILINFRNAQSSESKRFITGNDHNVYLEPGLPELPVIIKPAIPVSILPHRKLDVFIEVPLSIKILYGTSKKKDVLQEYKIMNLSRSFFGNSENGEFAYFQESDLMSKPPETDATAYSIFCPLTINNKSSQNLDFNKMILRTPYLSIYGDQSKLIASPVIISFSGQDQISQISYRKTPPEHAGALKMLAPPRSEEDKNLLRRSFYFIKNLYTG